MKQNFLRTAFFAALGFAALQTGATLAADAVDRTKLADPQNVPQTVKTLDGRELKLVWNDEFDGDGLPNPEKWGFEVGYIRNNEAQYYTDKRLENVFQKDGALTIRTLKEDYPLDGKPNAKGRDAAEYTSGSVETWGKASWMYGRVEVRAKLPKGKGIWPAIWMMGVNIKDVGWPRCGEIDVMEYVGKEPGRSYGTIHMKPADGRGGSVSKGNSVSLDRPEDQFYVYALEWTAEKMTILVDEIVVLEFNRAEEEAKTVEWPFAQPCYLKLNAAIGGAWGGEIAPGICPTDYQIDYVRVYQ